MKFARHFSIRTWVTVLLAAYALLIVALSLSFHIPLAERTTQARLHTMISQDLNLLQTSLVYLLRHAEQGGVERELVAYSSHPLYDFIVLLDEKNTILASSRKVWTGHPARDIPGFQVEIAGMVKDRNQPQVIAGEGDALFGYVPLPLAEDDPSLHEIPMGLLFCRHDVTTAKSLARYNLLQQIWVSIVIVWLLVLFLWMLLDSLLIRRVAHVVQVSKAFAAGHTEARCALSGADEIAGLGQAFDRMAAQIETEQAALAASEERLTLALEAVNDGLWDWNIAAGKIYYSPRWETMLGYTPGEVPPHPDSWRTRVHPEDYERVTRILEAHLRGETPDYEAEHRLKTKSGEWVWILTRGKVVARDAQGNPLRAVGTHIDITERKQVEAQIHYIATHDTLTGLPNRAMFMEHLKKVLATSRTTPHTLMFIDLDSFKPVNDQFGHDNGDRLLQEVAQRLETAVRKADVVARLGGDEFVILLPDTGSLDTIAHLAGQILQTLGQPFPLGAYQADIGCCIGIALFPKHGEDADTLLKQADDAMYTAKRRGKNRCVFA